MGSELGKFTIQFMNRRSFLTKLVGAVAAAAMQIELVKQIPVLEWVDDWAPQTYKRTVFYNYPNGSSPLTALLKQIEIE